MKVHAQSSSSLRWLAAGLAAFVSVLAVAPADAATSGQSAQGWTFLDGGIGQTETEHMQSERGSYSLWIITAARTTGANLADVAVTITNDKGEQVFERQLEGPWLMINLPLGRYEVRARLGQDSESRITTIHPGDHHQIVFYFNVQGDVLPKQ